MTDAAALPPLSVPPAMTVEPSRKLTIPAGVSVPDGVTVAVKTTGVPYEADVVDAATLVVVGMGPMPVTVIVHEVEKAA